jgi:peroxiredoxin
MMTTTNNTIADQVGIFHRDAAARLPAQALAAFGAEQALLDEAGTPAAVATPGGRVPDGELLDAHGQPTTLAAVRGARPAVIVFYRGGWCPYCNIALRAYEMDLLPRLTARGVQLIAVSPQKPDGSLSTQQTNELSFSVVSDPGNQLAGALGILTEPTPEAKAAQLSLGLDLTQVNADATARVPMPTTLIVDGEGIVRWIDIHPNYTTRSEVADVLSALDNALHTSAH